MHGIIPEIGLTATLAEIHTRLFPSPTPLSKGTSFFSLYESFLAPLRRKAITLMEVGIYQGESTRVFAEYFPNARIIGIDHAPQLNELAGFPNVSIFTADQRDAQSLLKIVDELAPGGLDVVIDDASHLGRLSLATWNILFKRVKPGGLYVVEDWATGYRADWHDGGAYADRSATPPDSTSDNGRGRIETHDSGMAGFIKHLVDLVGINGAPGSPLRSQIESLFIHPGLTVVRKENPYVAMRP